MKNSTLFILVFVCLLFQIPFLACEDGEDSTVTEYHYVSDDDDDNDDTSPADDDDDDNDDDNDNDNNDTGDDDDDDDNDDNDDNNDDDNDNDDNDDDNGCNGCLIEQICYEHGETNSTGCKICDVNQSTTSWSYNDGVPCDDGEFCNGADSCIMGFCRVHAGDPCDPQCEECDRWNAICEPVTGICDDGVFCNGDDSCESGSCSVHEGSPCDDQCETCDETNDVCDEVAGSCDDGLWCTGTDTCQAGSCSRHTGDPCGLREECREDSDECFLLAWQDPATGLYWQTEPEFYPGMSWGEAVTYCENSTTAGIGGWRLPTIGELRSLVDGCPDTEPDGACNVDDECLSMICRTPQCDGCSRNSSCYWPEELTGDCDDPYWSSSLVFNSTLKWAIQFKYAYIGDYNGGHNYSVRCVR